MLAVGWQARVIRPKSIRYMMIVAELNLATLTYDDTRFAIRQKLTLTLWARLTNNINYCKITEFAHTDFCHHLWLILTNCNCHQLTYTLVHVLPSPTDTPPRHVLLSSPTPHPNMWTNIISSSPPQHVIIVIYPFWFSFIHFV